MQINHHSSTKTVVPNSHKMASPSPLSSAAGVSGLPTTVDVLPELTPGGDVGQVSAYLQVLAGEGVASVLVVSHLPLVGYLVAELCPGETPPMFSTSAIASVTLDDEGKGTFNWQMNPCNLKMQKAM